MAEDASAFGGQLRVRVCGLLVEADAILLAQLHSPVTDKLVWMPPGGGLELGESMDECLQGEFYEETNLNIEVGQLVHINELVALPYHAIECYFEVSKMNGEPTLGSDPELGSDQQLLHDLCWISFSELDQIAFAPQSLIPKLQQWDHRFEFPIRSK